MPKTRPQLFSSTVIFSASYSHQHKRPTRPLTPFSNYRQRLHPPPHYRFPRVVWLIAALHSQLPPLYCVRFSLDSDIGCGRPAWLSLTRNASSSSSCSSSVNTLRESCSVLAFVLLGSWTIYCTCFRLATRSACVAWPRCWSRARDLKHTIAEDLRRMLPGRTILHRPRGVGSDI